MVEGIQYGGSITSVSEGYSVQMCHTPSILGEAHHQYGGGYAVWTCHIINIEEGVRYRTTKTAQRVDGGCIYLGK